MLFTRLYCFLGDSKDDAVCGRGAGTYTCILEPGKDTDPDMIDLKVDTLGDLVAKMKPLNA